MDIYPDEFLVRGQWEKQTLKVFREAIKRYIEVLDPLRGEGNHDVEKETKDWFAILGKISEEIDKLTDDMEQGELPLLGKNYGKLNDILWKYHSAKKQLLEERKRKVLEEAAHQGATEELEKVNIVLGFGFWEHVNRKKCLVESFYPKEEPKNESQTVSMQITIGNVYGQFAALNNGTMIQNNNSEAVDALRKITDALVASSLPDKEKQEALLDIETVQTQLKKENPNRKMLELGLGALQVAANAAQIYQAVEPHFHTIQQFITHLSHP